MKFVLVLPKSAPSLSLIHISEPTRQEAISYAVFGWIGSSDTDDKIASVDVRHIIDYRAEVAAGDILEIRAGLTKIGTKSITVLYEMTNLGSNEVAATLECVSVIFDLQTRKSLKIPESLRELASKHLIEKTDNENE